MPKHDVVAKVAVSSVTFAADKAYDYLVPEQWADAARPGQRVMVPFGAGNRKCEGVIFALAEREGEKQLKQLAHLFDDEFVLSQEELSLALWMKKRYFCTLFEAAAVQFPPGVWNRFREAYTSAGLSLEQALERAGTGKKADVVRAVYASSVPLSAADIARSVTAEVPQRLLSQLVRDGILSVHIEYRRKIGDKTIKILSLAQPFEKACESLGKGALGQKRKQVLECLQREGSLPEKELCYLTGVSVSALRTLEKMGLLSARSEEVFRRPSEGQVLPAPDIVLTPEQQQVLDGLVSLCMESRPGAALLHGVTGSGKTLVYIALIRETLKRGKSAILLVPEIALTPQMLREFSRHFGSEVAVMHSGLTDAQRMDEYKRVRAGQARVVVGTRSAVFAPVSGLGVVIIDEQQESTYHSESSPRYDAEEIAKYRCAKEGGLVVLGSATPSVDSYYQALCGKYHLFTLSERYNHVPLPQAVISDMRSALEGGGAALIGDDLRRELENTRARGEQAVLFINRRGSARMALCVDCGYVPECKNCSVAMTYHARNGRLMCHHCGYSEPLSAVCPVCGSEHIRLIGAGTQKVEEELLSCLPGVRVIRMDADTTSGRTSHEKLLSRFAHGEADILLGTQMVAKGLDFENVTLVGVLDADLSLYCGDYHAQERTFSLLAQVVGRAGRRAKPGRAVIQTYHPGNEVIRAAARQDYQSFYEHEIRAREALQVPPFSDVFVFQLSGAKENDVLRAALRVSALVVQAMEQHFPGLKGPVLGPAPCAIVRLNNKYRYTVSFRGHDGREARELISAVLNALYAWPQSRGITVAAIRNPPM